MSEKWAKGPWQFNGSMSIRDAYNRPIATVRSCDPKMDGSHNENRDTAILITAAPDLYEALDTLVAIVGLTAFKHESQRAVLQEAVNVAMDALKKSRGEE